VIRLENHLVAVSMVLSHSSERNFVNANADAGGTAKLLRRFEFTATSAAGEGDYFRGFLRLISHRRRSK